MPGSAEPGCKPLVLSLPIKQFVYSVQKTELTRIRVLSSVWPWVEKVSPVALVT